MTYRRIRQALIAAATISMGMLLGTPAEAQRVPGNVGIGLQLGDPSGVSLQFYSREPAWDFLAAWDFDDFFFLNVHALYDRPLGDRRDFFLFYGPGGFIGFRDRDRRDDDDVVVGISGTIGIGFLIEEFEIFGRITPRLSLVPDTDGDVGGGIGARYWF